MKPVDFLIETRHHNYTEWQINRPERCNALGVELGEILLRSLRAFATKLAETGARALVIRPKTIEQRGRRIAIAGGDLKELSLLNPSAARAYANIYQQICSHIETLPIPVIFVCDGELIGGGIELALAADMLLCSQTSRFIFKQTKVGLATGYGGATRLVETVGLKCAKYWLLTGANIDAQSALQCGLASEVFQINEEQKVISSVVQAICANSQVGTTAQKSMLNSERSSRLNRELEIFADLWGNKDHKSFLGEFIKKSAASSRTNKLEE